MAIGSSPLYVLTSFSSINELESDELAAIRETLGDDRVGELIQEIPADSVVVPRFRAIPFGDLLEREVQLAGSQLINTFRQHRNIANSSAWVHLLDGSDGCRQLTARQYTIRDIPDLPEGEWFVKGETNSLKNRWFEACYAPTTKDLIDTVRNVQHDAYVGSQSIVIKPFQAYRQLTKSITGQPIFHERRYFTLDGQIITSGFYWSSFVDDIGDVQPQRPDELRRTLTQALERVSGLARFLVIDVAEYEDGTWGVVELNDGSMSGLSECNPHALWSGLRAAIMPA